MLWHAMSDPFSYAVIGKAMEVHRELGPGVDEIFYHELLSERLRAAGIEHLFRPRENLVHRGIIADTFEPDLVFPGQSVAELKCLRGTFDPEHYLQVICYEKFWRVPFRFRSWSAFSNFTPTLAYSVGHCVSISTAIARADVLVLVEPV